MGGPSKLYHQETHRKPPCGLPGGFPKWWESPVFTPLLGNPQETPMGVPREVVHFLEEYLVKTGGYSSREPPGNPHGGFLWVS